MSISTRARNWKRSIREALLSGGDAGAAKMFPTKLVTRVTRAELVAMAKGELDTVLLDIKRAMKLTTKQMRREDRAIAAAKAKQADKVVKTAAVKSKVTINTGAPAAKGAKK